jgi:hypothetical protein
VRPQINKPLNVSEGFLSGKLLPDLYLCGAGAFHIRGKEECEQE